MHWFDSMGGDPGAPALGTWSGNKLCFQHQHHMGHSRYTYNFESKDTYTFKLEYSQDGQSWSAFLEGTYKRATQARTFCSIVPNDRRGADTAIGTPLGTAHTRRCPAPTKPEPKEDRPAPRQLRKLTKLPRGGRFLSR